MPKKQRKEHKTPAKKEGYKLEGAKIVRVKKACPRCGAGTFMAKHKDRTFCGQCHYTVFNEAKPVVTEQKDNNDKKAQ